MTAEYYFGVLQQSMKWVFVCNMSDEQFLVIFQGYDFCAVLYVVGCGGNLLKVDSKSFQLRENVAIELWSLTIGDHRLNLLEGI